jgi:hypothetical protein
MADTGDRHVPLSLLFWAGVAIVVVACLAVFTDKSPLAISILAFIGFGCILAAVLVPRFDESSLEASRHGFRLDLRRKLTQEIGEGLEKGVPPRREGSDATSDESLQRPSTSIQLADINHDGEAELVVQHPFGAHSVELQAFGWSDTGPHAEFRQLASAISEFATGFTVGDLDGDGRVEIASDDVGPGGIHAEGPTVEVIKRWDGSEFTEVSRRRLA